jgi:hypothetical protein
LLDFLTGGKAPLPTGPVQPATTVRAALLALNRDTSPWVVREGAPENCDLVAEWKIVDARWYEVFAKASLERTFKILMRLDEAQHEVRSVDHEFSVEWRAGVPSLAIAASAFRGQSVEVSFGQAYGFTEELRPGEIYKYRFVTKEMKQPLQAAAAANGWAWKGVAFGKL